MTRVAHAVAASLLLASVVNLGAPGQVAAEGSRDRAPTSRAHVDSHTSFSVFLQPGEILDMGSTSGDVVVRSPVGTTFTCAEQRAASGDPTLGRIASPDQVLGGPAPVADAGHYAPCWFRAVVSGVYRATSGPSASFDLGVRGGADADLGMRGGADADLGMRGGADADLDVPGRVFTYALAGTAAATVLPLRYYVTTDDGYLYRTDSREPAGLPFTVGAHGFTDRNPADDGAAVPARFGAGVPPSLPLSFTPLAPETLRALGIPTVPAAPALVSARFAGDIAAANSTVGGGGTFQLSGTNDGGLYEIVVSRDGRNFSPTLPANRVILAGGRAVAWDGRDNRGEEFPAGTGYAYRVTPHAGGYRPDDPGSPTSTLLTPDPTAVATAGPAPGGVSVTGTPVFGTLNVIADPGAAPTATVDELTTGGGTSAAVPAPGLLGNDTGTGLAVTATGTPAHGTVAVDPDGAYVYTPTASYSGLDTFAYTTTDSLGRTATARAAVRVRPAARDDVRATAFETPIAVAVLANDSGTALRLASVDQPPTGAGQVAIDGGRLSYTPPRGYTGVAGFSYAAEDATGQRSTAQVQISVAFPVVPAAAPDTEVTPADTATRVDVPGVLANDTGVRLRVISASTPAHGTVRIAPDGSYQYTPDTGFAGVDLFAYVVRDAVGRTSASTVAVTVLPPAVDDREVGLVGQPVTVDPLTNDAAGPAVAFLPSSLRLVDPAGGAAVLSVALAHQGTYTINPDGTVTFAPLAGFSGTPTPVRYEVRDTAGQVTGALIQISYTTGIGGATLALGPLVQGAAGALLLGLMLVAAAAYRPREPGRHRA